MPSAADKMDEEQGAKSNLGVVVGDWAHLCARRRKAAVRAVVARARRGTRPREDEP